jgi:hypothetical protein
MTEGQATQWPKENARRTSNTMTKKKGQKDKKHNGQKKRTEGSVLFFWSLCGLSFCPFLLVIVLLVLLAFSFGHCVACPSVIFF